jgi:hypothetical protein
VRPFLKFVAIGSLFSTIEELLTVVMIRGDWGSYIFTLLILFPAFLAIVFYSSRLLDRLWQTQRSRELAHFFVYGMAGLMIEWFLIGLSPWSNPSANPFGMLLFQIGMFSFWATVAFMPRLASNPDELSRRFTRGIFRFYLPYFALVYVVAFSLPRAKRFAPVVIMIIVGYVALNCWYARYFRARLEEDRG